MEVNGLNDIVFNQSEVRVGEQMCDVLALAGEEIVDAENLVIMDQTIT